MFRTDKVLRKVCTDGRTTIYIKIKYVFHKHVKLTINTKTTKKFTINVLILYIYIIFFYLHVNAVFLCFFKIWELKIKTEKDSSSPGVSHGLTHLEWYFFSFLPFYLFSLRRPHFFLYPRFSVHFSCFVFWEQQKTRTREVNSRG